jgi:hypothetical protein
MNDRKLLKQALDALEEGLTMKEWRELVAALRERLAQPEQEYVATVQCIKGITIDPVTGNVGIGTPAQPEQEPVEWLTGCPECGMDSGCDCDSGTCTPPAAQRTWVGLTDEEMWKLWNAEGNDAMNQQEAITFARAIEAKLKEKNT